MAMTKQQADELVNEYIAKRGMVAKYKSRVRGPQGELKIKRTLLEKCEFEPDNSRIGRSTSVLTRDPRVVVAALLQSKRYDVAATVMIESRRGEVPLMAITI